MIETYTEQLNSAYEYYFSFLELKFSAYASAESEEARSKIVSEMASLCASQEHTISEQGDQLIEKDHIIAEQDAKITELQDCNEEKDDIIQSQQIALNSDVSLNNYKDAVIAELRKMNREKNALIANHEAVEVAEPRRQYEKISAKYKDLQDRFDEGEYRKHYLERTRSDFVDNGDLQKQVASQEKALEKLNARLKKAQDDAREKNHYKHLHEQDKQKLARRDLRHEKDMALYNAAKAKIEEQAVEIAELKADKTKLQNDLDYERKKDKHGGMTDLPKSQERQGEREKSTNKFNHRTKTGNKPGGQSGHEKHTAKDLPDEQCDEVEEIVIGGYSLDGYNNLGGDILCPACGGTMFYTGRTKNHTTYDIKTIVTKKVETFYEIACSECGETSYVDMPGKYGLTDIQYGAGIKATVLTMMNMNYTPINKVEEYITGITGERLHISQGYIAKIQRCAAKMLASFIKDLEEFLTVCDLIHWDDTVVKINREYGCIRFYGTEKLKYYVAHMKRNIATLVEDSILTHVKDGTIISHDHWAGNYKEELAELVGQIIHAECNIHLGRRFKKNAYDTKHEEHTKIGEIILQAMKDRQDLLRTGANSFSQQYIADFKEKILTLLSSAEEKNAQDTQNTALNTKILKRERYIINDIRRFFDQYFGWLSDFKIPPDNNLSERALRTLKIRMKVSGQFKNIDCAQNFAIIKSYLETCKCNGVNVFYACVRLAEGNPLSLQEILNYTTAK